MNEPGIPTRFLYPLYIPPPSGLQIAYFDYSLVTHYLLYSDRNLNEVTVNLRRDRGDIGFCTSIQKPVELKEVRWIINIILGLKSVQFFKFFVNKMNMLEPWSLSSIDVISLEKWGYVLCELDHASIPTIF